MWLRGRGRRDLCRVRSVTSRRKICLKHRAHALRDRDHRRAQVDPRRFAAGPVGGAARQVARRAATARAGPRSPAACSASGLRANSGQMSDRTSTAPTSSARSGDDRAPPVDVGQDHDRARRPAPTPGRTGSGTSSRTPSAGRSGSAGASRGSRCRRRSRRGPSAGTTAAARATEGRRARARASRRATSSSRRPRRSRC